MDEQWEYYGAHYRFHISRNRGRDGDDYYMVRDAAWITDYEMFQENRSSPTVAQFATLKEAKQWCDFVEEGKITSVPHEANFEGWPALKLRVQGVRKDT